MPNKKPKEKSAYHHGDLKSALLDETARILLEEGEEALSLRRLAQNIGVSRTASYHYFKDKQGLLCAVAEEGFVRFNVAMSVVFTKDKTRSGQQMMRDYVSAYVQFAVSNPQYYDLMYGSTLWRSSSMTESLVSSARGTLRANVENITRRKSQGLVSSSVDGVRFSQVSWGTMHGISRLLIDGIYTDAARVQDICDTAADMLWLQLRPD